MKKANFEWDDNKNISNQEKHHLSKEKRFMKKIIKYTDEPIGDIKIIGDFLPSPKDLILKEENVKVTISLTKESVDFFKAEAKKHHTQYQKMIRNLLDVYADNHSRGLANP